MFTSILLIIPSVLLLVASLQQKARVERLAIRVQELADHLPNRTLDFFDAPSVRKLLSFRKMLDRIEEKVRLLEQHTDSTPHPFSRKSWPLTHRITELETRMGRLEKLQASAEKPV